MDRKRTVQKYRAFLRNAYDNNQGDTVCNILLMASSELKRYSREFEQLQKVCQVAADGQSCGTGDQPLTGADAKGNTQIPDKETINCFVYEIRAGHDPDGEKMLALIDAVRRFAYQIATPFFRQGSVHPDELDGFVFLSLSQAVQTYDRTKEMAFIGYFKWFLLRELINASANAGDVRLPNHVFVRIRKLRQARRQLAQQLGRDPSDGEIARCMGASLHEVHSLQHIESVISMLRLDAPVNDGTEDSGITLADAVKAPGSVENDVVDGIYQSLLADAVQREIQALPADLQQAVQHRYIDGMTLEQVADTMNTSRERVRNLTAKAMRILRNHSIRLREFLDSENLYSHTSRGYWTHADASVQELHILRMERKELLNLS